MELITKDELLELAKKKLDVCITILLPTARAKNEMMRWRGHSILKSHLDELKPELKRRGLIDEEIDFILKPAEDLIKNEIFWRNLSDGLALFLANGFFKQYIVPITLKETNYISREFYVRPLMQLFAFDSHFYLLKVKTDEVKLFEEAENSIIEIKIDDRVPARLQETVGYDYADKQMQYRTQPGHMGANAFHGQRDDNSRRKEELKKYFRDINKGILSLLHEDQRPPLILSCVDYHFALYKEVNTYQNLFPQNISVNSKDADELLLHDVALELLKPTFKQELIEKKAAYEQYVGTGKATSDLRELIPAALNGKIDTLFIEKNVDHFVIYDIEKNNVELFDKHDATKTSLMNLLAVNTFMNGGKVFELAKEEMPNSSFEVGGLFRF